MTINVISIDNIWKRIERFTSIIEILRQTKISVNSKRKYVLSDRWASSRHYLMDRNPVGVSSIRQNRVSTFINELDLNIALEGTMLDFNTVASVRLLLDGRPMCHYRKRPRMFWFKQYVFEHTWKREEGEVEVDEISWWFKK